MTLLTINPSASSHDGREASGGAMTLTSNIVLTSSLHWAGLILPNVTVPPGSTINAATKLYYKSWDAARDDPDIIWYAQDADDAAVLTTTNFDITNRTRTTASVTDSATAIGTSSYRQINIQSLIAEVVARGGWASGNDIALIGDAQGGCTLEIATYDIGSSIWYVEIDYTAPASSGAAPKAIYYARMRG